MLKRYSLIKKIKNDLSLYIATIPNHSKKKQTQIWLNDIFEITKDRIQIDQI